MTIEFKFPVSDESQEKQLDGSGSIKREVTPEMRLKALNLLLEAVQKYRKNHPEA